MRRYLLPTLMLVLLLWAPSVWAQCSNAQIAGCQTAVDPQPTDVLLGYQYGENPHVRKFTLQQLANTTAGTFTTLSISGNATIGGTLTGGASTLSSLSVPGAVTFGNTLNVAGAATIGATLTGGTANLAALSVSGSSALSSLSVTNAATAGGTLGVTGITTFGSAYVPKSLTIATLPSNPGTGAHVWVTNCTNGSETSGSATGCYYQIGRASCRERG